MIKDRLAELKEKAKFNQDLSQDYQPQNAFMKDFFDQVNIVEKNIELCQKQVTEIENVTGQISKSAVIDQDLKTRLDELIELVKNTVRTIKLEIKKINGQQNKEKCPKMKIEYRIEKAQYDYLSHSLFTLISNFNKIQLEYREMHKNRIVRQFEIKGREANEEELDSLLESGTDNVFSYELLKETQLSKQILQD
ncbi:Syntaxin-1A -like protein, partial [Brachionus plicatilis]